MIYIFFVNFVTYMSRIEEIQRILAPHLEAMNEIIVSSLSTPNVMMNDIVTRYLKVKGKQIRPLLVILSAKMFGNVSREALYAGAALEMLHNASLIHDDVVDETSLRRGIPTINAAMGNRIAVLVGDFFVSNALAAAISTGNIRVVAALSALGKELSLGEIDQISNSRNHHFDEDRYFSMINQKTASLFRTCVATGADVAGASEADKRKMERYAELLGLCFQIKDDIFDYFDDSEIGKPTGNDLRENKVTLPLLYALNNAPMAEAAPMRAIVERGDLTEDEIESLIEFAKAHGGIDYAFERMRAMQKEADEIIKQFPDSESREAFRAIFEYIIDRKK